jgi:glyoxylase-like metal-dependent hydrolase (beta-lactamase superfamily II)
MKLGELEVWLLTDGCFALDGGAMFGVIPRPLWERKKAPDARNRIRLAMNCLLVRAGKEWILVETGAGDKWDAKQRDIYAFASANRLPDQLRARGLSPEDISLVILTHLHFDHCGWSTRRERDKLVPTFPNARYVVRRGELEHASHPTEKDRGSYVAETFAPLEPDRWRLLDDDVEILPGIDLIRVPGHTGDMQCVRLTGGGKTVFLFADLVPTAAHLGYPWIMAFDLYPLTTLENKKRWIPRAAREGWLCVFAHDAEMPAAYLRERDGRIEPEPASLG